MTQVYPSPTRQTARGKKVGIVGWPAVTRFGHLIGTGALSYELGCVLPHGVLIISLFEGFEG